MEKILDFSVPLDVGLLDNIVTTLYTDPSTERRNAAQSVLTEFQRNSESWSRVDTILEYSHNPNTKFFALQILESVVKFRWKALPREQCTGIKNYIVGAVIKLSSDSTTLSSQKLYISKLDAVLVQIIKQEWPQNWENFIPEIVGASKTNESLCENNMLILQLLSEEVFDFSNGQMTAAKASQLKATLAKEFSQIFELCQLILDKSQRISLLSVTLETLLRFLNWIPAGYVLQTPLIDVLATKFFPEQMFRNITLQCLTEIAGLTVLDFDQSFRKLYNEVLSKVKILINPSADLSTLFSHAELEKEQEFIRCLALFLTTFLKNHRSAIECPELASENLIGHEYLAKITAVDDEEVFKICLEYWFQLASDLYHEAPHLTSAIAAISNPNSQNKNPLMLNDIGNSNSNAMTIPISDNVSQTTGSLPLVLTNPNNSTSNNNTTTPRRTFYAQILSKVRQVIIVHFAKPDEVLLSEDESGEVVRETVKDTEVTALYKLMREALVYLTHLDYADTQEIMLSRLHSQVDGTNWSRQELNSLSWAVGSISGTVHEDLEKRFVVTVIRDLLGLVEMKKGKDNKAAIAGNIMYVVGQYPKFLRAHWKFLKTVVNKLFEFMHESHPGVQDMAVDTFYKIASKCKRKFVVTNAGEQRPFVDEILDSISAITCDLEPQQQNSFYIAMGEIISSQPDASIRDNLIHRLMTLPNQAWNDIMGNANVNVASLHEIDIMRRLVNILKANVSACSSLGTAFSSQLARNYLDMLKVYKLYSEQISREIASGNPHATKTITVKYMRSVKQETLRIVEAFVAHTQPQDAQSVTQNFIPPLLDIILNDYTSSVPDARDAQVLSLLSCVIDHLTWSMTPEIPKIFSHVFASTLEMITKNFIDYPDHRIQFFELIRSVNQHCFEAFFTLTPEQFKLVMDSIVWAMKHTERTVAVTGLTILDDLLKNIASHPNIADGFYVTYYRSVLQDLFFVLTDAFHKAEFKQHANILKHLFTVVETGQVKAPLFTAGQPIAQGLPVPENNQVWLRQFVFAMLSTAFPNVNPNQMQVYVGALLDVNKDLALFKQHLRDFLVSIKEFGGNTDNAELFLEETEAAEAKAREEERQRRAAIPGMLKPSEIQEDMGDL